MSNFKLTEAEKEAVKEAKKRTARQNLMRELADIKFKLHFMHNDLRFKENKKEIVDQLEDLCDMIIKKRFG